MTTAPVRIGIIGRGFGARVVAPVFEATEGCAVVDVVSPRDGAAVSALCARADVDLIAVHGPPFLHREHVSRALDAGRAVLCDKPFGRNVDDAIAMTEHAAAAGVLHLTNFEFRQHPGRVQLRSLANEGAVGAVEHVQWSAFSSGSRVPLRRYGWLFDADLGGGWIGAWGSHAIDFLRWTFGEIVEASAELRTVIRERPDAHGQMHECTAEDGFTARLLTDRGITITIDTSFVAPVNLPSRITVIGSEGVLESRGDHHLTVTTADAREEHTVEMVAGDDPHLLPMQRWAAVVRDSVREAAAPRDVPTFADGVACAVVMDRLRGTSR